MKHPISTLPKDVVQNLVSQNKLRINYSEDGTLFKPNYDVACCKKDFDMYPQLLWCRGDVVRTDNYEIVAKGPNKFFNLNETEETHITMFDWNRIRFVAEKKDGHMILPFIIDNEVKISSRWSFTSPTVTAAEKYLNEEYKAFIRYSIAQKLYPLFELIDDVSFIKVLYPREKHGLYLVALVDEQGHIAQLDTFGYNILITENLNHLITPSNAAMKIIEYVNSFEKATDYEGVVITFEDGRSVKVKAEKYFQFDLSALVRKDVEYIFDCIEDKTIDDKKPLLPAKIREEIEQIETMISNIRSYLQNETNKFIEYSKNNPSITRKELAIKIQKENMQCMALVMNKIDNNQEKYNEILRKTILAIVKEKLKNDICNS